MIELPREEGEQLLRLLGRVSQVNSSILLDDLQNGDVGR